MSDIDSDFIKLVVAATQRVELEDRAATRLAGVMERAFRSMDLVAAGSLFDTEPAKFDSAIAQLAGDDDD